MDGIRLGFAALTTTYTFCAQYSQQTAAALALTAAVLMHVAWNLLARASRPDNRFLWCGN